MPRGIEHLDRKYLLVGAKVHSNVLSQANRGDLRFPLPEVDVGRIHAGVIPYLHSEPPYSAPIRRQQSGMGSSSVARSSSSDLYSCRDGRGQLCRMSFNVASSLGTTSVQRPACMASPSRIACRGMSACLGPPKTLTSAFAGGHSPSRNSSSIAWRVRPVSSSNGFTIRAGSVSEAIWCHTRANSVRPSLARTEKRSADLSYRPPRVL